MKRNTLDFETVMDIFDWFNSPCLELINHTLLSKLDGEERVRRAMPAFRREARKLVKKYSGTEFAYPDYPIN